MAESETSTEQAQSTTVFSQAGFVGDDAYDSHAIAVARTIVEGAISGSDDTSSFVMAVCGEWGSGKTRFVTKVLEEVKNGSWSNPAGATGGNCKNGISIMRFDPWIFRDDAQLLKHFFISISEVVKSMVDKDDISGLCDLIVSFGDIVSSVVSLMPESETKGACQAGISLVTGVFGGAGGVAEALDDNVRLHEFPDYGLYKRKSEIAKLLNDNRHINRIVVVIDDIDRLPADQICAVFRLVAAIADFPKISYVLVFDKRVVTEALGSETKLDEDREIRGKSYLEKIVHRWYELPHIDMTVLVDRELENLAQVYRGENFDFPGVQINHITLFASVIGTPRALFRLVDHYHLMKSLNLRPKTDSSRNDGALLCEALIELHHPNLFRAIADGGYVGKRNVRIVGEELRERLQKLQSDERAKLRSKGGSAFREEGVSSGSEKNISDSEGNRNSARRNNVRKEADLSGEKANQELVSDLEPGDVMKWLVDNTGYRSDRLSSLDDVADRIYEMAGSEDVFCESPEERLLVEAAAACMLLSCSGRRNPLGAANLVHDKKSKGFSSDNAKEAVGFLDQRRRIV